MKRFKLLAGLVAAMIAGNLCFVSRYYHGDEGSPVEILILDNFGSAGLRTKDLLGERTHGQKVADTAACWSLGTCRIVKFDAELLRRKYNNALQDVYRHVEAHPRKNFILNISLGSRRPGVLEARLLSRLSEKGVIIIAAAGNDGVERPVYPAALPQVTGVAACRKGKRASYSNYGKHVDLAVDTPLVKIARRVKRVFDLETWSITKEAGTSISAPKLAGMLGLLWSEKPAMEGGELVSLMKETCGPMDDEDYRQGKLGSGELSDYGMVLGHSRRGRYMAFFLLGQAVLLLAAWIGTCLGTARRLSAAVVTYLLFSLCLFTVYLASDLALVLKWGYTNTAAVFLAGAAVYLFFTASAPSAPQEPIEA